MSTQRYSMQGDSRGLAVSYPNPRGEWVRAEDCDRERRRWSVRALRYRADLASHQCSYCFTEAYQGQFRRLKGWCERTADAIERGDRLSYFERLGATKGDE